MRHPVIVTARTPRRRKPAIAAAIPPAAKIVTAKKPSKMPRPARSEAEDAPVSEALRDFLTRMTRPGSKV